MVIFFDTNVVIDVFTRSPRWFGWSAAQIGEAVEADGAIINAIVLSELSPGYRSVSDLRSVIEQAALRVLPIEEEACFIAGHAYARWRRSRAAEETGRVLPDFIIGAHALSLGASLVTRDQRIYRAAFPDLALITPETHPHG